jgi:membrane protein
VTAVLFELDKVFIGLYVASSITSVLGAAGPLVVLLVWLYYSAQVFLLGAEFTWVYAYRQGSRSGQQPPEPLSATPVRKRAAKP